MLVCCFSLGLNQIKYVYCMKYFGTGNVSMMTDICKQRHSPQLSKFPNPSLAEGKYTSEIHSLEGRGEENLLD